ncbi:flagellar hook-length control protein FliK [Bdellovibrio sp. HCB290]|uniref:flagellar hook-length control protein FliK n=1 Tax=Bdellovibrio sp. HCB290 TaxID=3394356 RepID=UPI0039B3A361
MLNIVGPPMVGATELKSQASDKLQEKDFKSSGADSGFGKALQDKISLRSPKETKESAKQETRAKDSNDSKEPKEEKAPANESKPERKVSTNDGKEKRAANRQQAIKEFMDSFESEFEIPPTRLVEAMAELDDSQLKQSPEVTAQAVIDQLDLDDDQAEQATAMYASLLAQLQQMPQPQTPKPMPEMAAGIGMSQEHMQMRVAAAQEKQNQIGTAVDNLNKKFWMKQEAPAKATAMPDLGGSLASRMMMDDSAMKPEAEMPMEAAVPAPAAPEVAQQSLLDKLPPHLQGQMKETMSPALLAALAAKQAAAAAQQKTEGAVMEESSVELTDEFTKALEAPRMEKPQQMDLMKQAVNGKVGPESFFQQENQGQSMMQNSAQQFMQQGMTEGKDAAQEKLTTKAAEFKSELMGLESLQAQPIKGESLKFDPAMAAMAPKAPVNAAANEANVKQLMDQAQYLIKKGGGEVKVQMSSEDMGTIHLKVMLQDGKVNLQMQADSPEAKKTIESSLVDLKNSLAAHKLSVENVKVDVVNTTSADTATQNQNNTNGQGQRDQARQFWNQFNDSFGNQGRRESFTDMQPLRGYAGKRRDPLQPIDTASVKAAPRTTEGKGSGLNLVA